MKINFDSSSRKSLIFPTLRTNIDGGFFKEEELVSRVSETSLLLTAIFSANLSVLSAAIELNLFVKTKMGYFFFFFV